MLGIRQYKKTAIDLYAGEMRWFYSELAVVPSVAAFAPVADRVLELPEAQPEGWFREALVWAGRQGKRHVAIAGIGHPSVAMASLKDHIDGLPDASHLKRVTFVLSDLNMYEQYQKALAATFIEGDSE